MLYFILEEHFNNNYEVVYSQVRGIHKTKKDAADWLPAIAEQIAEVGMETWNKKSLQKISDREYEIKNGNQTTKLSIHKTQKSKEEILNSDKLNFKKENKKQQPINNQTTNSMATKNQKKTQSGMSYVAPGISTKKGVSYFTVPTAMITLPEKNHTHVARKQYEFMKNGYKQVNTYVMGYVVLGKKRPDGKSYKKWYVAQLHYMGGRPAVVQYIYNGYNRRHADNAFKQIASTVAYYRVFENGMVTDTWKQYPGKTRQQLADASKAYRNTMRTTTKAQRQAYAKANPDKYRFVK